jgi:DNA-binding CsgD family transcriptional regulator
MVKSYVERFKSIDGGILASELRQNALALAAELENVPSDYQSSTLTQRKPQILADTLRVVEVAAIELIDDVRNKKVLPQVFSELSYLSLGYSEAETAESRSCEISTVKWWRKNIKGYMGTRTRPETVAHAIKRGLIHFEFDSSESESLSFTENLVLTLVASGWSASEIAGCLKLSSNTVERHYEEIRGKLKAKNMPHAVRRAFEVGIFNTDEAITSSAELVAGARVSIDQDKAEPVSLIISDPREIDLLKKMALVGDGTITTSKIVEGEGSCELGKMSHAGKSLTSLGKKLEQAAGFPVLVKSKLRINGKRVYMHRLTTGLTIETNKDALSIPECQAEGIIDKNKKIRQTVKSQSNNHIISGVVTEQVHYRMAAENLPEVDETLLKSLSARDSEDVLQNTGLKVAISRIVQRDLLDYRTNMVIFLRYGIPPRMGFVINRGGEYLNTKKITEYVPQYQGLDLRSSSLVSGVTPRGLLQDELNFIERYMKEFPSLASIGEKIKRQIKELNTPKVSSLQ